MNLGVFGQVSAGWVEKRLGAVLDTGPDFLLNQTERLAGPRGTLSIDTYDQPFFPTRGIRLEATYFDAEHVRKTTTGLETYARAEARLGGAISQGRWTLLGGLEGGTATKGGLPITDSFALGGPRRLSGFAVDQLLGGRYAFGRAEAQYRLSFASPLYGLTLLGGVMAEAGRMEKPFTETNLTGWQRSLSVYIAANTFLGPVYLGVADAKNGKGRFYLFIGTP